ncbi:tRNA (adenosine(37)-N6)-dimethylallyltransferase MiaA [Flavobacteriaceae bacterium]|jgi:tRNA dimethylallyltransferase|nr:tRNA (adenosine(37)-N6)-dimethylallyltransferase MiaA [Flavobacteriaceae bacterium]
MDKYLISIVGPTAIGKTNLAIQLAEQYSTEVISADSRQFYEELNIGTAKPSNEDLNKVKHHLINNKSIKENYSIGEFEKDAIEKITNVHKKSNIAILVGGSGLYIDVINYGLDKMPKNDDKIREFLNNEFKLNGLSFIQNQLKEKDLISYNNIDLNNHRRIIRALEVSISSGKPYSSYLNKKKIKRNFKTIEIGLKDTRELIYERINNRVDTMVKDGLIQEVKELVKYKNLNSLNTIGYKEIFNYLDNTTNLKDTINKIKKNTRRFSKRQMTWFKSNKNITWFKVDYKIEEIIRYINDLISD